MPKIKVGILGATGTVGQRFVQLLQDHPWFEIGALTGSERTAGRTYGESCRWVLDCDMPAVVRHMPIHGSDADLDTPLVFSALPSNVAGSVEERLAAAGHIVCSNAANHRMADDVPLLVPEVNPDHLGLIEIQRKQRGWNGAIVTNPNCTSTPLVMALHPLHQAFGVSKVLVVSMQALSGAGYPGVPSYDAGDNVIPYISGEEPKVETEPQKILGLLNDHRVKPASIAISAHCNRVPVLEGHLECISVALAQQARLEDVIATMGDFRGLPQELHLPSAPHLPIIVRNEPDRPQTRRDRDAENGMATVVGRIRPCSLLMYKFVALAHNTIRGAAGGSILNAELMVAQGIIKIDAA